MTKCNSDLEAAYRATTYWAITETDYIPIRIGALTSALDSLLRDRDMRTWAFITAANPYSKPQNPAVNAMRNAALRLDLENRDLAFCRGLGVEDDHLWPPEDSYLILNISVEDAVDVGRTHEQNAVVVGRVGEAARLVFCDDCN